MKKTGVILLGFLPDPRFEKRIALEKELCDLHVVCWDRCQEMMKVPDEDGFVIHCLKIKAENDPLKRLIPYYKFMKMAKKILKEINPDYIHVQGLDMLKIACSIKKWSRKKVSIIYDVADLHRLLVDKQTNLIKKFAQIYMKRDEIHCCKMIDLLIVTSKRYYIDYFQKFISNDKLMYYPNLPDLSAFYNYKKKDYRNDFTVGFIGAIRYKKQMENLVIAARKCNVKLLIAGYEVLPAKIEHMCKSYRKGEWVGQFDFKKQIADLYGRCDVMYSVYNADMENVKIALPNKLYEGIYCNVPLIVAKDTYLSQIVEKWKIGVSVDHRGAEELINAIEKMKSDGLYYLSLCENCNQHKKELDSKQYVYEFQRKIESFFV